VAVMLANGSRRAVDVGLLLQELEEADGVKYHTVNVLSVACERCHYQVAMAAEFLCHHFLLIQLLLRG
jgi:hypothetical protein